MPDHGTWRAILRNLHPSHVAGQHDYGHPSFSDCTLHGDVKNALKLLRIRNQLTVVAAFFEKNFRMSFLEISGADLTAWNMRGDREYRSIAAMSIEESVDQVKVTGATAAAAGREFPAELSLGPRRERGSFFVAHVNPLNFAIYSQSIRHRIQTIAHDAVKSFDTRFNKSADQLICHSMCHGSYPPSRSFCFSAGFRYERQSECGKQPAPLCLISAIVVSSP